MATKRNALKVSVLNEKGSLFYGDCTSVTVPSERDILTILPFHTPMIAKLGAGKVIIRAGRDKREVATIERGLIYVGENEVTVLVGL